MNEFLLRQSPISFICRKGEQEGYQIKVLSIYMPYGFYKCGMFYRVNKLLLLTICSNSG